MSVIFSSFNKFDPNFLFQNKLNPRKEKHFMGRFPLHHTNWSEGHNFNTAAFFCSGVCLHLYIIVLLL